MGGERRGEESRGTDEYSGGRWRSKEVEERDPASAIRRTREDGWETGQREGKGGWRWKEGGREGVGDRYCR